MKYVVVQTDSYHKELQTLQRDVGSIVFFVFVSIVLISWVLSKFFMRPIRQKMQEIEQFIQNISHELNTPITALTMSSKKLLQKKLYDEKALRNISISTKQLYSIYKSLAYLSFSSESPKSQELDLHPLLLQTLSYYEELLDAKSITLVTDLQDAKIQAVDSQMELLFSNLLSNAIKYSMPKTNITLTLKEGFFSIEDEGLGIDSQKLEEIFTIYKRDSQIAGGFGVGLHIVKQICDAFSIEITVKSQLQKGSCFTLKWESAK